MFNSADGALSSANTDLFLPYAFAQSNVATASDITGRRQLHGIFDLPDQTVVNDADLVRRLTKNHSLSKITLCGELGKNKVDGVQVEYGIFNSETGINGGIIQGDVHGSVSGTGCVSWDMRPDRTVVQILTTFAPFQVNYIQIIDSLQTPIWLIAGTQSEA